ncbi:sporulation protein [Nonomuraea sp. NN258]|uniref:GerW family sporulation protein n=1 Tax=Nonomuraea antri TaxID=2730852 RepID=UPI001568E7D5|nr:spore germination protein GerW family protein [Nonomuraea antri]NRQ36284.1 sporulation protein [Nonomuraea antri]
MDLKELMEQAKDAVTVQRVFGEPIHHGDVVVIPVAKIAQGGGGGSGQGKEGEQGGGGGFGFGAHPAGVYVIKNGDVRWEPAIDVNRIVLAGQLVGIALLLTIRAFIKKRRRRGH